MVTLKKILASALAVTAGWLIWLISNVAGGVTAAAVGLAAGGIAVLLVLRAATRALDPLPGRRAATGVAIISIAGVSLAILAGLSAGKSDPVDDDTWDAFDPLAIHRHVAVGTIVFIDVTADWCLTCAINKKLVLDTQRIANRLNALGVVKMRADWTRPDHQIAAYLASFDRYGIPFNAVYGPANPTGTALPELLTSRAVEAALNAATDPVTAWGAK